jgi:hypothetical protein
MSDPHPERATREQEGRAEIEITPEMIRAGVAAYYAWDSEKEEPEALVAAVFFAMTAI